MRASEYPTTPATISGFAKGLEHTVDRFGSDKTATPSESILRKRKTESDQGSLELELQLPRGEWSKGGYPVLETLSDGHILVTFHNSSPSWYVAYNILEPR